MGILLHTQDVSLIFTLLVIGRMGNQRRSARSGSDALAHFADDHRSGRQAAEEVDAFLVGNTRLAHQGGMLKRSWLPPAVTKQINGVSETASDRASMDLETVSVATSA